MKEQERVIDLKIVNETNLVILKRDMKNLKWAKQTAHLCVNKLS